jgi:hypothetical protein
LSYLIRLVKGANYHLFPSAALFESREVWGSRKSMSRCELTFSILSVERPVPIGGWIVFLADLHSASDRGHLSGTLGQPGRDPDRGIHIYVQVGEGMSE